MFTCPECETPINQAISVCPYCGADVAAGMDPSGNAAASPKKKGIRQLIFWAIVLIVTWGLLWLALPLHQSGHGSLAEASARGAIGDLQSQLASFAAAQGYYPESLETLGTPARLAAQEAKSAGYQLQYVPGESGADGRIHSYSLLARPDYYGSRNFYTDQTGVLRVTTEDRAATPQDPPV
jgi:hypothetical protein